MTTYFHYIGGSTYTPAKFVAEAQAQGISRRAPVSQVKGMKFSDRVILLDWRKGRPAAFAEFTFTRMFFDADISKKVGDTLVEEGRCEYHEPAGGGGGTVVSRECGEYIMGGSYSVKEDVTVEEICEKAEAADKERGGDGQGMFCMVGGYLTKVYDVPMTVINADGSLPKFTRGFMKVGEGARIGDAPVLSAEETHAPEVVMVQNYERKM